MLRISSGIFGKIPHSWKLLSTIYRFSWWVDLIGNCHYLFKNIKFQLWHNCKSHLVEIFLVKKGGFSTSVFEIWWIYTIIISLEFFFYRWKSQTSSQKQVAKQKKSLQRKEYLWNNCITFVKWLVNFKAQWKKSASC